MRLGRGGEFWSLVEICSGEFLGAVCGTKKWPDEDIGPYGGRRGCGRKERMERWGALGAVGVKWISV